MVWTTADLGDRVLCYPKWPDGLSNDSIYDKIYNVLFLLFTYIVPIGSMTYTYVRIGIELWGSQSIGECTQRQMENIKNKRRVSQPDPYLICHSTQLCRSLLSCQDDDGSSYHLRCVLAAIRLVLHRGFLLANNHELPIRPRNLLGHILVSDEQLNVQSNNILLDERKVSPLEMYIPCYVIDLGHVQTRFQAIFSWLPYVHVSPAPLTRRGVFTSGRRSYSGSPDHNRIVRNGMYSLNFELNAISLISHFEAFCISRCRWCFVLLPGTTKRLELCIPQLIQPFLTTDQSKIIKFDLIFRPGTVRTQLYNACQTPSTTDTYYTNVHDHEMGAYNSSRGSRKSWKNTEMRQLS
ncbi:g-protein coupled receptor [Holotrichia oblita]|uniref:G-protein coupled receptor n=1 Tax=Holotrichia oblita TaxID=644536 RepID=A0ACB9SRD8_HOLOL|nr:g-protein coupled receptor [Holotrichia oblita]